MNAIKKLSTRVPLAVLSIVLSLSLLSAGGIRNKGKLLNPNGSTITARTISNGVGATGGTIQNGGTITLSPGASFFNFDSLGGAGGGTFWNILSNGGNHFGTLTTNNLVNTGSGTGTFNNDSASIGGGTVQISGAVTNGTPANFVTALGKVEYNGTNQTISSSVAGATPTYGTLKVSASGANNVLGGNLAVATNFDLATGSGTVKENGNTLTLNGSVTTGLEQLDASSVAGSTTIYNGSGVQAVVGAAYYNVYVQNTGLKTAAGGITVVSGGNLKTTTANDSLDMATFALDVPAAATLTNNGRIKTAGTVTALGTGVGGTFVYYGSGQSVLGVQYNNLTLRGTGNSITLTGTVSDSGSYSIEGTPVVGYGTSTFAYNGSSAQSVVGGQSYYTLAVTGSADTSLSHAKTVTGGGIIVNLAGGFSVSGTTTLDMQGNSLTLNGSSADSIQGGSRIRWSGASNTFVKGTGITELYGSTGAVASTSGNGYGALWLSNSAGSYTLSGNVTVSAGLLASTGIGLTNAGSLTVANAQNLIVTGEDLNNDGTLTNNGSITVN